jgi:putative restriction endonuclease
MLRSDVTILSTINGNLYSTNSIENNITDYNSYAFEGEKKYVLHLSIERKRSLRDQKINMFLQMHGQLFCELCKFRFIDFYPFLKEDIIEVHHIVPLSTLEESTLVTPEELMLLCANCHLAIHQGDAEKNLQVALGYFEVKADVPDR